MSISILLAHSDNLERSLMRQCFDASEDFEIVAAVSVDFEAIEAAFYHPDVAIIDDDEVGRETAMDIAADIKKRSSNTNILLWTGREWKDGRINVAITAEPGWSYLDRHSVDGVPDLFRLVKGVASGMTIIDPSVLASPGSTATDIRLTRRQMEVLALVADGLSNRSISARLSMAERTVEYHLNLIYKQLGHTGDPGINARTKSSIEFLQNRLLWTTNHRTAISA